MQSSPGDREILILFGSETRCARDTAHRVASEVRRYHFIPIILDMDSVHPSRFIASKYTIFVCSTTGQGEAPGNMKRFWRLIRRRDFPRLHHLNFAIFGLGDSSYPLYNAVARRLRERLLSLGASMLVELGLGDDQHPLGYDGIFSPWLQNLLTELLEWMPMPKGLLVDKSALQKSLYESIVVRAPENVRQSFPGTDAKSNSDATPQSYRSISLSHALLSHDDMDSRDPTQGPALGLIRRNIQITSPLSTDSKEKSVAHTVGYSQQVQHIVFDLAPGVSTNRVPFELELDPRDDSTSAKLAEKSPVYEYNEGDVICIYPPIPDTSVNLMLQRYNLHPMDIIKIKYRGYSIVEDTSPEPILTSITPNTSRPSILNMSSCDSSEEYLRLHSELQASSSRLTEGSQGNMHPQKLPQTQREGDFPAQLYAFELFTWYLNFHAVPQRHFFHVLAHVSTAALEKERLEDLISADYAVDLDHYCFRERRSFAEVISDFPSCELPLDYLLEFVPRIVPRSFSIASSYKYQHSTLPILFPALETLQDITEIPSDSAMKTLTHPNYQTFYQAHICIAKVAYSTPYKRPKYGLCSSFLCDTLPSATLEDGQNSTVWYCFRKATFKPPTHDTPAVMIGPGTGVASVHAITEDRVYGLFRNIISSELSWEKKMAWVEAAYRIALSSNFWSKTHLPRIIDNKVDVLDSVDMEGESCLEEDGITSLDSMFMGTNMFSSSLTPSAVHVMALPEAKEMARRAGLAPAHLLFGCRFQGYDHHYADFFNFAARIGALDSYHTVFSRTPVDQTSLDALTLTLSTVEEGGEKKLAYVKDKYVQDRLKRGPVAEVLFSLLHGTDSPDALTNGVKKGMFILAGNAKQMPREVRDTVIAIVAHFHPDSITHEQAMKYVEKMADDAKYVVECWS